MRRNARSAVRAAIPFLFFCTLAASAFGEDREEGFFPKDYAENPLDDSVQPEIAGKKDKPTLKSTAVPGLPTPESEGNMFETPTAVPEEVESPESTPIDDAANLEQNAVKAYALGGIFDSRNSEELKNNLHALVQVAKEKKLAVRNVYAVGPFLSEAPALSKIMNEGWNATSLLYLSKLVRVSNLPEKYKEVKTAPTYIVWTEKGEVILEGINSLSSRLTKDGQLVLSR